MKNTAASSHEILKFRIFIHQPIDVLPGLFPIPASPKH